jgi:hypothetical protein
MTVLVANDDLTVIGGPTSINVSMDLGGTGKRGSQIFISPGNPNDVVIGQDPEVFDICINTLKSDEEYLYMYQYQNLGAVKQWVPLFNIIPDTFSANLTKSFSEGSVSINIPITDVTATENLTAENFNIQHSIVGTNPISSSISIGAIDIVDDIQILPITIKAVEFVDDTWSLLAGTKVVHLAITVV